MAKPVTISELVKRKSELKENRNNKPKQTLYVKSLDGHITIQKPDRSIVVDALEMADDGGDHFTLYECVVEPNLKSTELHKEFGVEHNPHAIADEIFEVGEISQIARKCLEFAGYGNTVKVVDKVKNS